eukprot:TRINITY_DN102349_c0_g1_i1.p1 TRINITY_DN102349_c0_g1~~TRINITY_DN102349_c0_g1_i1.p1  ORF type:complete len:336 (-),score=80.98 TRINITY_DN102349_c0_g1_i1:64-1071(-)
MRKRSGKNDDKKAAKGETETKTDEELIAERKRKEAFQFAAGVEEKLGWATRVLGVAWFLIFNQALPQFEAEKQSMQAVLSKCVGDSFVLLLVLGMHTSCVARSPPKPAQWAWWRKPWHVGWCVSLVVLAAAFIQTNFNIMAQKRKVTSGGRLTGPAFWIAVLIAIAALMMVISTPKGDADQAKGCFTQAANLGRGLLVIISFGLGSLGFDCAAAVDLSSEVGPALAACEALPLFLLAAAFALAYTEAELVAGVHSAMLLFIMAGIKTVLLGRPDALAGPVAAIVVLSTLFLPFPAKEVDTNPFYTSLQRSIRGFKKMMASPVSGWGDDGEAADFD